MSKVAAYCRECGNPVGASVRPRAGQSFCDPKCRKAFHNRRAKIGAVMYDLVMCWRHERDLAQEKGVQTMLSRLASRCHYEDLEERDGRKSWRDLKDVLADRPDLATTTHNV